MLRLGPLLCASFWVVCSGIANGQICLKAADRTHGELTVKQIFVDRPDLGHVVAMDDPFVDWLEEQFAGSTVGDRLYWDKSSPVQSSADYLAPNDQSRAFIRVSGDAGIASVDRCALFVYVLSLASESKTRDSLVADATRGMINRDEFVSRYIRMDLNAKIATKKLLVRFGFAKRESDKTPYTSMFLSHVEQYDAFKAKWQADARNPMNPYPAVEAYYDGLMAASALSAAR